MPATRTGLMRWLKRCLDRTGGLASALRLREAWWTTQLRWSGRRRAAASPDGLPVPPERLMVLVGGKTTAEAFFGGGVAIARTLRQMCKAQGVDLATATAILDFGCGCGRITRQWSDLPRRVAVHGTDYNPDLVAWCAANLTLATFAVNRLEPPLSYADRSFDLVYAFSVFTHFPERLQRAWFGELARITRPGGHFIVTLHVRSQSGELTAQERATLADTGFVARYDSVAGTNLCAAFHTEKWLRRELDCQWQILAIAPDTAGQDFVMLRRREPGAAVQGSRRPTTRASATTA